MLHHRPVAEADCMSPGLLNYAKSRNRWPTQCRQVHVVQCHHPHPQGSANYPFCTIDPNVGVVTVLMLASTPGRNRQNTNHHPNFLQFVDIAGLVKGAAQGEGLGNKFLSHIREVDAIIQVIRCFEDEDIHHVAGSIDPIRDIETILTELVMADMESVQKSMERRAKDAKRGDKDAKAEYDVLAKVIPHLNEGKPVLTLDLSEEEWSILRPFFLLTAKPTIFAANVKEDQLAEADQNPYVEKVRQYATDHHACDTVIISAQIESDLVDLAPEEAADFLKEMGVEESGVGSMIRQTYHLLGLQTFFTAGEKEVRAWTIQQGDTAPQAAGVIHTDFERGFIKAETVAYEDLVRCGSVAGAREKVSTAWKVRNMWSRTGT